MSIFLSKDLHTQGGVDWEMHGGCRGVSCYRRTWCWRWLAEPLQVLPSSSSPCWSLFSLTEGSQLRKWKFSPFTCFWDIPGCACSFPQSPQGRAIPLRVTLLHLYPKLPSSYLLWVCRNKFIFVKAFLYFLIFLMRQFWWDWVLMRILLVNQPLFFPNFLPSMTPSVLLFSATTKGGRAARQRS